MTFIRPYQYEITLKIVLLKICRFVVSKYDLKYHESDAFQIFILKKIEDFFEKVIFL